MLNAVAALHSSFDSDEPTDRPDLAVSFEEMSQLMDLPGMRELERRFLTPAQLAAKYGTKEGGPRS